VHIYHLREYNLIIGTEMSFLILFHILLGCIKDSLFETIFDYREQINVNGSRSNVCSPAVVPPGNANN
jgi:hypothetical protein